MSAGEAQLRFAADFAIFLVAGSGLALLVVRPQLLVGLARARGAVAAGFAALVAAAFVGGGGFVDDTAATPLVAVRATGAVLLAAALVRWRGGAVGRLALAAGVAALLAAEGAAAADEATVADTFRLVGAALLATGIFLASRRSIPTRIATSASATLLAVVLAVSVALSAVLADNVEDEARRSLGGRADTEAGLVEDAGRLAVFNATLTADTLGGNAEVAALVQRLSAPDATDAERALLVQTLEDFAANQLLGADPQLGPLLVLAPDLRRLAVAVPPGTPVPSEVELAGVQGSNVVADAARRDDAAQSLVAAGGAAFAVAAAPIEVVAADGVRTTAAFLVVTSRLDEPYVVSRLTLGPGTESGDGLVLATRGAVLARSGSLPVDGALLDAAAAALDSVSPVSRLAGDRLVAAHPVLGADGAPVLALVLTTPTAALQEARADLFRLLFLVAIGGTLLALVLTAVVGERIGSGLRRLTAVAGEVRGGNLAVESGLRSDDELGVLSEAFDSMTGSLRRMTGELRDAAEDEARLRARMEAVVGGMGEALVAVDAGGTVTDFNAAAEILIGVPAAAAVGRPVTEVVSVVGDDGSDVGARLGTPVAAPWGASGVVRHASGTEVPVVVSAGALPQGAVFLLRDVRREREAERVKSELLSNISHELRTPLSPIKGYSQILRARELPPDDVRRFANEIEKASSRLERVVVQLVNFAAMSAGRYEVHTEPTVVRDVLDRAVARWSERVDPDVHPIRCRAARSLPKVWLDRQAVEQALDELLDNAVKYSPDGCRIDVGATAAHHPAIGPVVRIGVEDAGVGIPTDRLGAVLEDFTQADGSATRSFGGLGLGLALVGRIVRAHGGDVELSSSEGTGTTVTMVLPVGEEG